MEYRTLGNTGAVVSALCLGTMTFGTESDEKVAHEQLDRFVERGGSFVDTANVYSRGVSEEIIGRWLAARRGIRDRMLIATKGRFATSDDPNDAGLSRVSLTRALEASLRRLGVDAIDLYQAHAWDPLTPIEETLRFFDDAVRAGKIRYVGVSNVVGWQLQKAALLARHLGLAPIVTLQPQYNLLQRSVELELSDVCRNEGIGILPWSPLGGGWLTGKYERDTPPTGRPGWVRTPTVAWRRTAGATRTSAPGASSRLHGRWPGSVASPWRRWQLPGCWIDPRSPRSSSARAPSTSWTKASGPPACTYLKSRLRGSTRPARRSSTTIRTDKAASPSATAASRRNDQSRPEHAIAGCRRVPTRSWRCGQRACASWGLT